MVRVAAPFLVHAAGHDGGVDRGCGLGDLAGTHQLPGDAQLALRGCGLDAARELVFGRGDDQIARLREEDVEVQLDRELVPAPKACVEEPGPLGGIERRADQLAIAPARPRPRIGGVEHADIADTELRQLVGERQPLDARADDHHVVAAPELASGNAGDRHVRGRPPGRR